MNIEALGELSPQPRKTKPWSRLKFFLIVMGISGVLILMIVLA